MKKLFFLLFLFLLVLPFGFSASLWGFDSLKYNFFPVGGFSDINGGSFWFSFLDVNVVSVGDVNAVSVTAINFFGDGSGLTGITATTDVNGQDVRLNNVSVDGNLGVTGDSNFSNVGVSGNTFLTNVNVAKDLNVETIRTTGVGGILSINAQETGLRSTTINPTELYFLNQADNNWAGFYFDSDSVYPHEFVFIASDNATKFIVESDANFTNIGVSGYYFGDGSKLTGITASGATVTMDANNTERLWLYGDLNKHFPGYIGATSDINIGIHALTATDLNAIRINVKGNVSIDKNVSALDGNFGNISIPLVYNVTQEPSGFVDRTTSSLSFVDSTRVFTITGTNFPVFINGIEKLKSTENITIDDGNATHWIYYAANGVLSQSLTAPSFSLPLIATIYYNTDIDNGVLGEERHGLKMDVDTHHVLHYTVGTRYESGLTGTFDNTTFSTTAGKIDDEDLEHSIGAQTRCKVFYKSGSSDFVWDANTTTYYKAIAGTLQYNNGNVLANVTNNKYAAYWVFATNDLNTPIWSLMGQREDTLLADARNNNKYESLILGTLPFQEMKLLYRVIVRNQGGTPTYIEAQDLRNISNLPAGTFIASQHNALTGLNWSQAGHTFDADLNVDGYAIKAFGDSNFANARFSGNSFLNALFATGDANFSNLKATGGAFFNTLTATGDSNFVNARISGNTFLNNTNISGYLHSSDLNANFCSLNDLNNWYQTKTDLNANWYGKNDINAGWYGKNDINAGWYGKGDINAGWLPYIGANKDTNMGIYDLRAQDLNSIRLGVKTVAYIQGRTYTAGLTSSVDLNVGNGTSTGIGFSADSNKIWSGGRIVWDSNGTHGCIGGC